MLGVDGIGLDVSLHAMRVNFRMQVRGRHRLGDVVRTCAMASTCQRAPDGEQHGKEHQQQDTNSSHKIQLSTSRPCISRPEQSNPHENLST